MRLTTSVIAAASAFSVLRNFRRAGVAKKRSRTSTIVPGLPGDGRRYAILPPSTAISLPPALSRRRLEMLSRATEPIDGSASPRKPSVRMSSSVSEILEVQCRRTASSRSATSMPEPLSETRSRLLPPPDVAISMRVAPASRAFSISSLAALAGRSMTSPAAIWLMRVSESCLMAIAYCLGFAAPREV